MRCVKHIITLCVLKSIAYVDIFVDFFGQLCLYLISLKEINMKNTNMFYEPNTTKWIEDLLSKIPPAAMTSITNIQMAGTEMCCSVCGDRNVAGDFVRSGHRMPEISIRLCDDCKCFQEELNGFQIRPLTEKETLSKHE